MRIYSVCLDEAVESSSAATLNASKVEPTEASLKAPVEGGTSNQPLLSRMMLNDHKAGMEGLDRDKINAIIHEASKGWYISCKNMSVLQGFLTTLILLFFSKYELLKRIPSFMYKEHIVTLRTIPMLLVDLCKNLLCGTIGCIKYMQ